MPLCDVPRFEVCCRQVDSEGRFETQLCGVVVKLAQGLAGRRPI